MTPAWFSEVEAFPSAVLAHHWPDVPNLGDMTKISCRILLGEIEAPDVLVGGTPCQAFSVAGMREGMADARGQLTMKYVELANAIDTVRTRAGNAEAVIVWENVPGVLSDKQNAFGCFLGALAGEDRELQPSGKKWTNAGCVYGPQRAVAWRVLDAQYFGVAQRRRRVFVVASARTDFDPAAVLFESEGVRRDTPPRREKGQGFTHDAAPCLTSSGRGVERPGETRGQDPVVAVPLLEPGARTGKSTTDPRAGMGIGTDGDPMYTLQAGKQHGVAVAFGQNRQSGPVETSHALNAHSGPHGRLDFESETFLVQSVTGNISHTLNTANNGKGCSEDGTGRGVPTIAFSSKDYGGDALSECSPTLRAGGHSDSHANAGVPPAVTVALRGREGGATAELGGEVATALRASTGGGDKPHVLTVHGTQDPCVSDSTAFALGRNHGGENAVLSGVDTYNGSVTGDVAHTLRDGNSEGAPAVVSNLSVRRLTPPECEKLQGFPPGHTLIPTAKRNWHRELEEMRDYFRRTHPDVTDDEIIRLAADGPRYKAIGNSMAVPVMRWIGQRIQQVDSLPTAAH